MDLKKLFALFVALVIVGAGLASADEYVLTAAKWGSAQTAAVTAAGGTVVWSHAEAGIGVARSSDQAFQNRVLATRAFQYAGKDMMVQWQPPEKRAGFVEAAVTPGDETFINAQWNIDAIEARGAWDAGYTGQGVRVAVLDGGIYSTHIDLDGNVDVTVSRSFVPGFAFNEDVGTFWHGTHVAGIIAAKDNAIGTIGVAPKATIIGVKVLHNGSGEFGWVIAGILYASTPLAQGGAGADIINMSLGALVPVGGRGVATLLTALNRATSYANFRGVTVVAAAGNDALDLDHVANWVSIPAQSVGVLAVSATGPLGWGLGSTDLDRPASYTNFGQSAIDFAAPGGDFMLPGNQVCSKPRNPSGTLLQYCWVLDMVMAPVRGSGSSISTYSWAAGTSMSAPVVAGVAALIVGKYGHIPPALVAARLRQSADDLGKPGNDDWYGLGRVNAWRAVQ